MAAPQDQAALGDHRIVALAAGQRRVLDDPIERHFGAAPEDRENGRRSAEIERIIAPFALRDLGAIGSENQIEFLAVECNVRRRGAAEFWLLSLPAGRQPPEAGTELSVPFRSRTHASAAAVRSTG